MFGVVLFRGLRKVGILDGEDDGRFDSRFDGIFVELAFKLFFLNVGFEVGCFGVVEFWKDDGTTDG